MQHALIFEHTHHFNVLSLLTYLLFQFMVPVKYSGPLSPALRGSVPPGNGNVQHQTGIVLMYSECKGMVLDVYPSSHAAACTSFSHTINRPNSQGTCQFSVDCMHGRQTVSVVTVPSIIIILFIKKCVKVHQVIKETVQAYTHYIYIIQTVNYRSSLLIAQVSDYCLDKIGCRLSVRVGESRVHNIKYRPFYVYTWFHYVQDMQPAGRQVPYRAPCWQQTSLLIIFPHFQLLRSCHACKTCHHG